MRNALHFARLPAAGLILLAGGCGTEITPPELADSADVRPYVTGAAAADLTADGLFVLPAPTAPAERPIITPERARALAAAYVFTFGPPLRRHWEEERGRTLDISHLEADSRVFYTSTPYGLFPPGYHPAFMRGYGPWYLVRMMSGSTPTLHVAVAAYASEVEIDSEGYIRRPVETGMEFVSQGIPVDTTRLHLPGSLSPEAAVVRVGRLTGARVSEVPELLWTGLPLSPASSLWKLTLDRAVRVRATQSGRVVEVRYLYGGAEPGRRLMIPTAEQPTSVTAWPMRTGLAGEEDH
jgi:hypothetical protein